LADNRDVARHIVLLRGINLGPNRRVAMADLRDLLTAAGYRDVQTYLQSGNVLLSSDSAAKQLGAELEQHLRAGLDLDVAVVVRSREELADVVARNPLARIVGDPRRYQVTFLSAALDPARAAELAAVALAPEQVVLSGREIYAWHPSGVGQSALAKLLSDPRLGVTATARNWKIVTKLLELADA
jgi:uncharacterized protein (DUF1697 family)